MLKANRSSAAVLTALVLGFVCLPALGGTPVGKFVETVRSGWPVAVLTRSENNQIVSIRIAPKNQLNRFVDISANNGEVPTSEIMKVQEFFDANEVPYNQAADRRGELLTMGLDFDPARPGPVPDGVRLRPEADGSTSITDQRGSEQGRIPKGASVAGKQEAVVSAVAKRSADGLISSRQTVLPASNPVLKQTADMVRGDIDAAQKQRPGMLSNFSAKQEQDYKDAAVMLNLLKVQDAIRSALNKVRGKAPRMDVAVLKKACEDNQLVFEPADQDGWFAIRDPADNNQLLAVGQPTRDRDGQYVDKENLRSLYAQINDVPRLLQQIVRDTPEELGSQLDAGTQEVKSFMEAESKSRPAEDPTRKDPKPDDPSTGGGGDVN